MNIDFAGRFQNLPIRKTKCVAALFHDESRVRVLGMEKILFRTLHINEFSNTQFKFSQNVCFEH